MFVIIAPRVVWRCVACGCGVIAPVQGVISRLCGVISPPHLALEEDRRAAGDVVVERDKDVFEVVDGPLPQRLAEDGEERPHRWGDGGRVVGQIRHLQCARPTTHVSHGSAQWRPNATQARANVC
eukprot:13588-Prorocentrum_minimum.AAC.2